MKVVITEKPVQTTSQEVHDSSLERIETAYPLAVFYEGFECHGQALRRPAARGQRRAAFRVCLRNKQREGARAPEVGRTFSFTARLLSLVLWSTVIFLAGAVKAQLQNPESFQLKLQFKPFRMPRCDVDDYNDGFVEAVHTIGSNSFKTRRTRTNKLSRSGLGSWSAMYADLILINSIEEAIERIRGSKVFTRDLSLKTEARLTRHYHEDNPDVSLYEISMALNSLRMTKPGRVVNQSLRTLRRRLVPSSTKGEHRKHGTEDSGGAHLHEKRCTLRRVIQKTEGYNFPLCLAFVDYEKAFDSIETWAVMQALQRTKPIPLQRGVRQGDVIAPKLFTVALEDAFKVLDWKGRGININGGHAETMEDFSAMLADSAVSDRVGLKMNMGKTKVMSN
ncbi:hypothetical protein MSG28_000423 [Choristoneura fumiferana]|uniref:Uncharacterized protein n=1 Tax=Choristoneura fumiferana TaxID=7141 RepID=A0ACC0K0P8_CHOFU|nr:hypothetical protein MSG28_000423 [Choristoneura fumiferana]